MKPHCYDLNLKAAHMLRHDHHECTCSKSLMFSYTIVVFEVLLLEVVEFEGSENCVRLTH